jgi:hypothetical protein
MPVLQPDAFPWRVPAGGYLWADAITPGSAGHEVRVLMEAPPPSPLSVSRRYDPLAEAPALYRHLADCLPTEEGILAFANKWGSLGESIDIAKPTALAGRKGELLPVWIRGISELRQAVWIWDRLTSASREEQQQLTERVRRESGKAGHTEIGFDSHPHLDRARATTKDGYLRIAEVIASEQHHDNLSRFDPGEVAKPAREFLCRLVNRGLQARMSPRLDPDHPRAMPPLKSRLPVLASIRWAPATLLAACWWQLAQTISGVKEQRLCPGCKKWFEMSRGDRSDKIFCGDACRKQVFQEKKETARRLRAEGKPVKAIAAELGADLDQVKKWISNTKG